jgi:hypothetical protein
MVNRHRGDVPLEIGGRRLALRLTLGGLAELEDALGGGSLAGLGERLSSGRIGTRDIIAILRIGLAGGGQEMSEDEVAALAVEGGVGPIMAAIAALFTAAFGTEAERPANPPQPQPER